MHYLLTYFKASSKLCFQELFQEVSNSVQAGAGLRERRGDGRPPPRHRQKT